MQNPLLVCVSAWIHRRKNHLGESEDIETEASTLISSSYVGEGNFLIGTSEDIETESPQ